MNPAFIFLTNGIKFCRFVAAKVSCLITRNRPKSRFKPRLDRSLPAFRCEAFVRYGLGHDEHLEHLLYIFLRENYSDLLRCKKLDEDDRRR